jgi:DNA primase
MGGKWTGTLIGRMIPSHLDLRRLKQTVTIEQVLGDRGLLDRLRRRGHRLVGPCPLHGGDNPTAFSVDVNRNIWHCFTGCNGGGDVVEMARRLSDGTFAGAARYLAQLADTAPVPPASTSRCQRARRFRPFIRRLELDPTDPFLARKGINRHTAHRYEVGAYRGSGMLSGCIGLRLLDPDGDPLGYAGRRLDPLQAQKRGKWVFPPRLPKSTLLYGYHQVRHSLHRGAVVVECPWGVLRLTQLGIPAVALLGTSLSSRQRALLRILPTVVLLLDGDRAGRLASASITARLPNAVAANLPDGLDPDDLSDNGLLDTLAQPRLPF